MFLEYRVRMKLFFEISSSSVFTLNLVVLLFDNNFATFMVDVIAILSDTLLWFYCALVEPLGLAFHAKCEIELMQTQNFGQSCDFEASGKKGYLIEVVWNRVCCLVGNIQLL
jgi:hypothetical protein